MGIRMASASPLANMSSQHIEHGTLQREYSRSEHVRSTRREGLLGEGRQASGGDREEQTRKNRQGPLGFGIASGRFREWLLVCV